MMIIVRKPVLGPRVAMKAVAIAPRAPKQNIVAIAWLNSAISIIGPTWITLGDKAYGRVKVKTSCARVPIGDSSKNGVDGPKEWR